MCLDNRGTGSTLFVYIGVDASEVAYELRSLSLSIASMKIIQRVEASMLQSYNTMREDITRIWESALSLILRQWRLDNSNNLNRWIIKGSGLRWRNRLSSLVLYFKEFFMWLSIKAMEIWVFKYLEWLRYKSINDDIIYKVELRSPPA